MAYLLVSLSMSYRYSTEGPFRKLYIGAGINFGLDNALGYFLEHSLKFPSVNRHVTPYLFDLVGTKVTHTYNHNHNLGEGIFVYIPEQHERLRSIKFPTGTLRSQLTGWGDMMVGEAIESFDNSSPTPEIVKVPYGGILSLEVGLDKGSDVEWQRQEIQLCPRTDQLTWKDRNVHFTGWDFSDKSYLQAFPGSIRSIFR